jgi:PAS domain S-box-containing protein
MNFFEGIGEKQNPNRFIVLENLKDKIMEISPSVKTALGYAAEEVVESGMGKILNEESANSDKVFIQKIIGKRYLRLDAKCKKKNGKIVSASICYRHFSNVGKEYIIRIIDVIQKPSQKLLDEATFGQSFFCDVVTETDENGVFVYVSESAEKFIGLKPEGLVGHEVGEFLMSDEEKKWRLKNYEMLKVMKRAYKTIPVLKIKNRKGETLGLESYCTPFYDDSGNFIGFRNLHWIKK